MCTPKGLLHRDVKRGNPLMGLGCKANQDLRLGDDELTPLRNADVRKMLQQKKLHLVINLDHIVFNSSCIVHITPNEQYLMSQTHLSLQVSFIAISGPTPPELGNLTALVSLDLCNNKLSASVPDTRGKLSKMNFLEPHSLLFSNFLIPF